METKKITANLLESVGCIIDVHTLDTYPAPRGIHCPPLSNVLIIGLDVYPGEAVHFDDVTDEWLENLSPPDLFTILKLVRDTTLK